MTLYAIEQSLMPGETGKRYEYDTARAAKTWAALDQYRERDTQHDWWPGFVRRVLGHQSAATTRPELDIFSE
jgi:hypothetical protein